MSRAIRFCQFVMVVALMGAAGVLAESPPEPLLLLGVYEGHNPADPRPAESAYFRTQRGGFQVIKGFAGYMVVVEVIKKPAARSYTRAILQDPLDILQPYVYDGVLEEDTGTLTLRHVPVPGLELEKDYMTELVLYADEGRTKELDRLTQLVRSYVDTTGPELKISSKVVAKPEPQGSAAQEVPEHWKFNFDSRQWQLGYQQATNQESIREYVLRGETVEDWSELVTSTSQATDVSPRELYARMERQMSVNCPSLRFSIIEESASGLLLEWRHGVCRGYPSQHEIRRIARVNSGILTLAYVAKTERLSEERRRAWIAILREATMTAVAGDSSRKE